MYCYIFWLFDDTAVRYMKQIYDYELCLFRILDWWIMLEEECVQILNIG